MQNRPTPGIAPPSFRRISRGIQIPIVQAAPPTFSHRGLSLKAFGRRLRCKPHRRHGPASETLNINVVSSASRVLPLMLPLRTYRCGAPLGQPPAHPRRGAAHRQHRQAAGAAAWAAAEKRGVTRLRPHTSRQSAQCPLRPQFQKYRRNAPSAVMCHTWKSTGLHSIRSSARESTEDGTVSPSSFAAVRSIASSNLVGK